MRLSESIAESVTALRSAPRKSGLKNGKIRVMIADDHPVVRKGLQSCLGAQQRLNIVGEAADGEEALTRAKELTPDVILMDISMPKQDGLAVTQALRQVAPRVKVLVLSAQNNRESIFRIIQAGAQGYVSKNASPKELLEAIESVYNGEAFFTPEVAQAALNHLVNQGGKTECASVLTEREREVLVLIAEGKSNKEIACQLNIGVRTIETHRERIMRRLDIHSVAGLTRFAIAKGLVSLESPAEHRCRV